MTDSSPLPPHYQAVLDVALSQNPNHFYTSGGCGVLAALMAEASVICGTGGRFNLIMRQEDGGWANYCSHITFLPNDEKLDLDIYGDDAEEQWIELISEEVERDGGDPEELVFDDLEAIVTPGDDIQALLEEITEEQGLHVDNDWVRANYPTLRDMLQARLLKLAA